MDLKMESKNIGNTEDIEAKLDDTNFYLFAMKEPDFVMKMMATYGALIPYDSKPESKRE